MYKNDIISTSKSIRGEVKEILSKYVEEQRDKKRIAGREFLSDSEENVDII